MKSKLKLAVLGAGSLGKEHVRIYSDLAAAGGIEFAGLYDAHEETAKRVAEKHRTRRFASVEEALESCDGLSIVSPTTTHFQLAKMALEAGKHVLVEKPMTDNGREAGELVALAAQQKRVLQVGHVERFNPVFNYLEEVAKTPKFIETHRLS